MGLFDRFRSKPGETKEGKKSFFLRKPGEPKSGEESFFLDADNSSSLGDVDFMRRSNTIRHTFPGTADNPGMKERFEDVASMEAQMGKVSEGLPEAGGNQSVARVDPGVPKAVKKTFAQQISQQQLQDRLKGSAVSTNVPGTTSKTAPIASAAPVAKPSQPSQPTPQPAGSAQWTPAPAMKTVAPAPGTKVNKDSSGNVTPGAAKPGSIDPFKDMLKDMR